MKLAQFLRKCFKYFSCFSHKNDNTQIYNFSFYMHTIRIVNQRALRLRVTSKVLAEPRISISRSDSGVWSTNYMSGNERV